MRGKGVEGVVANALDENAVLTVVRRVRPDAVIEELTSLPKRYTPEEMRAAAERDRNLRLVGGRNIQNTARAAGAKRYIVQSTGFFYGPGLSIATEKDALAENASPGVAGSVRTYMQIEERVLGDRNMQGLALRYGFFYGPGTYHDPKNGSISAQVQEQSYPVIGSGRGVFSFVHVEDAAAATVAALEAQPGVYNVVDDDPLEMAVWLPAFARFLERPRRHTSVRSRRFKPEDQTPCITQTGCAALPTHTPSKRLASRRETSNGSPRLRLLRNRAGEKRKKQEFGTQILNRDEPTPGRSETGSSESSLAMESPWGYNGEAT